MKEKHYIDLSALQPYGKANIKLINNAAVIWTTNSITPVSFNLYGDSFKKHYAALPGKYRLPFRIDMTVKLDFPAMFLFIGNGHITVSSPWQDNRKIEDIANPSGKPNQDHYSYNNNLPLNEFIDISVIYNFDEMQILFGGEERFYSRKQSYMKAKNRNELNEKGFSIGLAVSKLSTLTVKAITITEYENHAPVIRGSFEEVKALTGATKKPNPTIENIISNLPKEFQDELIKTDSFLKSLQPMKFKRIIDKRSGKITYIASDFGVSYAVKVSDSRLTHDFGWYWVHNGKPETWYRNTDYWEEILAEISKSDLRLAERIFYALNDCIGCYGSGCLGKELILFNGQKRLSCHGRVVLRMYSGDFHDIREFFRYLNTLMEQKIAEGSFSQEKVFWHRFLE